MSNKIENKHDFEFEEPIIYSFEDIISKKDYPKAYTRSFVVVEKYNELQSRYYKLDEINCQLNYEINTLKEKLDKAVSALEYCTDIECNYQSNENEKIIKIMIQALKELEK
jgi:hypothetical protein